MGIQGNYVGPGAVDGTMQPTPSLQNPLDRGLPREVLPAAQVVAEAGCKQLTNRRSLLITLLRALSTWS